MCNSSPRLSEPAIEEMERSKLLKLFEEEREIWRRMAKDEAALQRINIEKGALMSKYQFVQDLEETDKNTSNLVGEYQSSLDAFGQSNQNGSFASNSRKAGGNKNA